MAFLKSILFIILLVPATNLFAQKDSTTKVITEKKIAPKKQKTKIFSADTGQYNPRVAILRSAILPGWGQFTNKKYWKIPIVYGALGTTGYIFFRNIKQYKEANAAYKNAIDNNTANDNEIPEPYHSVLSQPEKIKSFRNEVRQNVDYSVLFFVAFWGLNVVDAAVDAHLKTFDVSDDLTLQIKPGYSPLAKTNGLSLVLDIHSKRSKLVK